MTKVQMVRKEYGEKFSDVVAGYARMGYSRTFTANLLDINLSYFRMLCSRFDLHKHFRKQRDMLPESRGVGVPKTGGGWPRGKERPYKPRYSDEYLFSLVRKWPGYMDFMCMAPVHISTLTKRYRCGWGEIVRLAQNGVKESA
jgi:hypothetical protein